MCQIKEITPCNLQTFWDRQLCFYVEKLFIREKTQKNELCQFSKEIYVKFEGMSFFQQYFLEKRGVVRFWFSLFLYTFGHSFMPPFIFGDAPFLSQFIF